jgi:peptidyl-prolyl cis-trans isomerase A (cyclophilin A)
MNKFIVLALLTVFSTTHACDKGQVYSDKTFPEIKIKTSMGDIVVELDRDRAPITVNNFLKYVKLGAFKDTIFHRVEKNFVIQGGGYLKGYKEVVSCGKIFNESGNGLKNTRGTIAMARYDDPHSATSQFYFNLTDTPSLDPNAKNWGYTVFGEVVEGMDILDAISQVRVGYSKKIDSVNVPIDPITILSISLDY